MYLSPEGVIELLGRLLLVPEHQENMAKCTSSTSVAVNSKHGRVHEEYRMEKIKVRRNPLTCLPGEILKCWSMKNKEKKNINRKY